MGKWEKQGTKDNGINAIQRKYCVENQRQCWHTFPVPCCYLISSNFFSYKSVKKMKPWNTAPWTNETCRSKWRIQPGRSCSCLSLCSRSHRLIQSLAVQTENPFLWQQHLVQAAQTSNSFSATELRRKVSKQMLSLLHFQKKGKEIAEQIIHYITETLLVIEQEMFIKVLLRDGQALSVIILYLTESVASFLPQAQSTAMEWE